LRRTRSRTGAYNRPPNARTCASAKMSFPNIGLVAIQLHEIVSRNCRHWHGVCIVGAGAKRYRRREAGKPGSREAGKPGSREAGKPGSREAGKPGSREAGKPGSRGRYIGVFRYDNMGNIFPGYAFSDCHDIGSSILYLLLGELFPLGYVRFSQVKG
jgi:hypothetical protein